MARPKKTAAQRRAERFAELYRVGKSSVGLLDRQIAAAIGVTAVTMVNYKKDPCNRISVNRLAEIGGMLGWTDEDFLSVIHGAARR